MIFMCLASWVEIMKGVKFETLNENRNFDEVMNKKTQNSKPRGGKVRDTIYLKCQYKQQAINSRRTNPTLLLFHIRRLLIKRISTEKIRDNLARVRGKL